MSEDDAKFDVCIIGTGLTESIVAAALSKWGLKVVHIDQNAYYGSDEAAIGADELVEWAKKQSTGATGGRYSNVSYAGNAPPAPRSYSLSLSPSIIQATGPLIASLISSGVSRYSSFKLLERTFIGAGDDQFTPVPSSKAAIFSSSLSNSQKRKLMRLLLFCASPEDLSERSEIEGKENLGFVEFLTSSDGPFSLGPEVAEAVAFALAFCDKIEDPTLPALQRIQRYLRSSGRYGDSPFIIGHYGGLGEIAQGFCRMSAVHGGAYILGHNLVSLKPPSESGGETWKIEIEDIPDVLEAKIIISNPSSLPANLSTIPPQDSLSSAKYLAKCIAITDSSPTEASGTEAPAEQQESTTYIFPPREPDSFSVSAFVTGQHTLSSPSTKHNIYLQSTTHAGSEPAQLLGPYLEALSPSAPDLAVFFVEQVGTQADKQPLHPSIIPIHRPSEQRWTEIGDALTLEAERVFREAMRFLKRSEEDLSQGMWPAVEATEEEEEEDI